MPAALGGELGNDRDAEGFSKSADDDADDRLLAKDALAEPLHHIATLDQRRHLAREQLRRVDGLARHDR